MHLNFTIISPSTISTHYSHQFNKKLSSAISSTYSKYVKPVYNAFQMKNSKRQQWCNACVIVRCLCVFSYQVDLFICQLNSKNSEAVHKCWGHNWVTCCVWGTVELADVVYRLARQDMLKRQMRNLGRMHKRRCRFSTPRIKLTTV